MLPSVFKWILLIVFIVHCRADASEDADTERILRSISPNRSEVDVKLARTLNIISKRTERGRLVLLLCSKLCGVERRMVGKWVDKFNDQQGYSVSEKIANAYHLVRQPLPFLNETGPIKEPTIAFLIGKEVFIYPGEIQKDDQDSFLKWLEELDQADVIFPKTHQELDSYLNTENCSDKSIARIVRLKMQIKTIFIRRPIRDHQMATVLFKRLPLLNELDCVMMAFVQLNFYSYPLAITTPAQMVEHLSSLTTANACIMVDDGLWLPIRSSLSDLEMEYFTGERQLFHLEQSTAYLIVGATSGVAVIALAISIFWGLNGTAFAA